MVNWVYSQCTPISSPCTNGDAVEAFGGLCDTTIMDGVVNQPYTDDIQFYIEGVCFDPEPLTGEPAPFGATVRITQIGNLIFSGFPNGIVGGSNQANYTVPQGGIVYGCGFLNGTPTQVGVFAGNVNISANATTSGCFAFTVNESADVDFGITLTVLPDPSFNLANEFCESDPTVTLTPTGTTGGTFSGPGVVGSTFNPAIAGPGNHAIKYVVSAQQGSAIAPASDSLIINVTVEPSTTWYADQDGDGFGTPGISVVQCDQPNGFVDNNLDCNDNDPDINPNTVWFADLDGDGYHDPNNSVTQCEQPTGFILLVNSLGEDCDDTDADINPTTVWFADLDGDGFHDPNNSVTQCEQPNNFILLANSLGEDCDDTNADINPNSEWVQDADGDGYHNPSTLVVQCQQPAPDFILLVNSLGEDCDDNDDTVFGPTTWYEDADGDGFGNPNVSVQACTQPSGFVDNNLDCDDTDPNVGAGANVVWYADQDGDGYINPTDSIFGCTQPAGYILLDDALGEDCDDTDPNIGPAVDVFYLDADGDGFGNPNIDTVACEQPIGYVDNNLDCDDADSDINPNTVWFADLDGDGYHDPNNSLTQCERPQDFILLDESLGEDCDDTDAEINPATEWFADLDGDGYHDPNNSIVQCERPQDFILLSESLGEDCDDTDPVFNAGMVWYADLDGDGYHDPNNTLAFPQFAFECQRPTGFILLSESLGEDCDDTNVAINPNTEWFADLDGDGYHDPNNSIVQCERPEDFILLSESLGEDCDDTDAGFNEPLTWYEDADGDGFGNPDVSVEECEQPAGFVDNDLDCDDTNPNINPDAVNIPNSGIDEDCSGSDSVTTSLNSLVVEYLNVYPNPGSDVVNIDFEVTTSSSVIVEMYSLEGRTIYYESTSINKQNISLNTNDLSSGMYIIRISDGTQSTIVKWIKM